MFHTPRDFGARKAPLSPQAACVLIGLMLGFLILETNPNLPGNQPSSPSAASPTRLVANYGKLPLSFEVNEGQTDRAVKFLSRGSGYRLFLTGDEAVLALNKSSVVSGQSSVGTKLKPGIGVRESIAQPRQGTTDHRPRTTTSVLRMRLVGANAAAKTVGQEELPGKVNYFLGNDPKKWRTNVPTYAQVKYQDIYPSIDLVYYGNEGGQLEYDFVVAPGADPGAIRFALSGGLEVGQSAVGSGIPDQKLKIQGLTSKIESTGDLVIETAGRDIRLHMPLVYQSPSVGGQRTTDNGLRTVDCHYVLTASNQIRFALGAYDRTKPLVIDPVLSYSTYLGGSIFGYSNGIAVDSSGNAYVTGFTLSPDFPTVNPLQATYAGSLSGDSYDVGDVVITKLNATGSALVYSTYLGGSGNDTGYGIAVDSSGNAYVTGYTTSPDFPTVNPLQATLIEGSDAFVAKLNTTGSALVYSTYLGGSPFDTGYGIAADSSGNAYVTGQTYSTDFPTVNPLQATLQGNSNAFVTKLNAVGSAVYSTYLGGGGDRGNGIAVDSFGNAYVVGSTISSDFPTVNPLQATNLGGTVTVFVAKLNATGSALVYSTYLGGSMRDYGNGIAVDSSGNAYVTGETFSTDFPTVNPIQATCGAPHLGCDDAFVAKLNAAGSALVYSTFLGGTSANGGGNPGLGGNASINEGAGIAVDSSGIAYVTGSTVSLTFPIASPIQATCGSCEGVSTAFVAKLNAAGSALLYSTYLGGSLNDQGFGIAADSAGNAYVTGLATSTNFPVTPGAFQPTLHSGDLCGGAYITPCTSAFVAKLSPAPYTNLSGSSLSFGSVLVDATSPTQSVVLTAGGDAQLNLTSITASGDFALVTTGTSCPYGGGPIAFQATCTIDVSFKPTATGNRTGTATITDNAPGSPHLIQLSGTGIVSAPNISPMSLSFSGQLVGTSSASQPVTFTNTGPVALNISSLTISGGWTQSNNCLPSVAANASCTINVSFQPTSSGPLTGALTLTDYTATSPQTVTLTGTGLTPVVSLSATSLTFVGQGVSTTSASQPITLTNTGTGSLTSLTIMASGDFAQTNNCTAPVAPTAGCTINVTFTPTAPGNRAGAVTLTDSAANSPQTVSLSGTGLAPVVSLSASSLTFAGRLVSTPSASQPITLSNAGPGVLTSLTIAASGDFAQTNNCTAPVAPTAGCTINVTFSPTAIGNRTGSVTLTDNATNSPQTVSLSGTGLAPVVSLSASSLTFAGRLVSTPSASQPITLSNAGTGAVTSLTIAASGDFGQTNNCTAPVAPTAGCTINVTFTPTATGNRTGTLTLTDNAPGSPQSIQLSGTGMDFAMSSSAMSTTVAAGQTANYSITVTPEGGLNQTVSLTCSGAPTLATCTLTPASVALNGSGSAPVAVAVSTMAGTMAPPLGKVPPPTFPGFRGMLWLYALLLLAGLAALAGAKKPRAAYGLALCLAMVMLWSACELVQAPPATHTPGTPAGTFQLVVNATVTSAASSTKITHALNLSLTVQ